MKKIMSILVCALLLVSLLAGCGSGKSSKFNDLADQLETVRNGDFSTYEELAPAAYWEYMEEEYDHKAKDAAKAAEDRFEDKDGTADQNEEDYGDNWEVSYEVIDEIQLDEEKLGDIAKLMKETYEIKKDAVTDAYKVCFKRSIEGDDDRDISASTYYAIEIDGEWYLCNLDIRINDKDEKEISNVSFVFG